LTKTLATICARGGSKGVPGKNLRLLCGQPLLVHTIAVARECQSINRVIVSTDDPEIKKVAGENGAEVPFLRPKELALDSTPKLYVIKHVVDYLESQEGYQPDIVVDLDPTSPLRTAADIESCIRLVRDEGADNVFSVTRARRNPYFNMVEFVNGRPQLVRTLARPVVSRQEAPEVYDMNASIYVWKREVLMKSDSLFLGRTRIYEMPEWAIDIDNETDFEFVEFILNKKEL
jgi:CMP-N,N'-diacetyllegionaminic acid synthase